MADYGDIIKKLASGEIGKQTPSQQIYQMANGGLSYNAARAYNYTRNQVHDMAMDGGAYGAIDTRTKEQRMAAGAQTHQERLAKQESLKQDYKALQSDYAELNNRVMHGKIGVDYKPEDVDRLTQMEADLKTSKAEKKAYDKKIQKGEQWAGRDEKIREYEALRDEPYQYMLEASLDPYWETNAEKAEALKQEIQERDVMAGNGVRDLTRPDRWRSVASGTAKDLYAGAVNLAGNIGEGLDQADFSGMSAMGLHTGESMSKEEKEAREAAAAEKYAEMYAYADRISESAAADLTRAKEGLGALGRAGVDVAQNVLQMGFDAGVGAITGGGSLAVMFARVVGSSMREARQEGASVDKRWAYGLTKAAVEVATEKMFDGVAGIYGAGEADEIVEALIRRLNTTSLGKSTIRLIAEASGEGLEELISGLTDPFAEAIITGKVGKLEAEELLYSSAIGFAIGLFGAGTSVATGKNAQANVENAAITAMYDQMGGSPTVRQELADRSILSNLKANPSAYANPTIGEQADEAMLNLAGQQSKTQRATELQNAAAQAAEAQTAAREKELGVTRRADGRTVSRNGVEIKMPNTATQNTTFILLTQFSAEEAADIIANNKAYQEAFTEMTGLDLEGSKSEVRSQIESLFTRTNENATQSEDNSDHTETTAEEQNATEQASDELNNQPEETAEQDAPKGPRIGKKRGRDIAWQEYGYDVQAQAEAREEANRAADVEGEEEATLDFRQRVYEAEQRVESDVEVGAEQAARIAEQERAEREEAERRATYEERRKAGRLTEEEKAAAKERAEAVRSKDTNERLPKLAEWAKKWAEKWKPQKAFPGDKIAYHAQLASAIQSFTDGLFTAQELYEAYEALNSEDASANSKYFYEGDVATNLENLVELRSELVALSNSTDVNDQALFAEKADAYERLCEQTVKNLQTKLERLQEQYENRNELAWQLSMEARVTGHGVKQELATIAQRFLKTQSRVDTFFRFLGGFNKLGSKAWYKLADRTVDAERRFITIGYNARSYFYQIQTRSHELAKAWSQLESGKLKGNVKVPGIGKLSLNYELSLLRTLETPGGITHIAGHGAELAHEGDYYAGRNNNGWGNKQEDHEMIRDEDIRALAEPYLKATDPDRPTFEEWEAAKVEALENLRGELKEDVMSFDIGKAAYEASQEMAKYMALEINKVSTRMFGYEKALNKNYYPLEEAASGNNAKSMSERVYDMDKPDFLKPRNKESKQALKVTPFAETMMGYIQEASNWCAFGEIWSDLQMLDKSMDNAKEHPTITGMIGHAYGEYASKYLGDWEKVISNNRPKTSYANRLLGQIRKNIAQASLTLNPGVALKQTPSYYAAAGTIDMDILIKSRIMTGGPFRTARSYRNNRTANEVNSRSGIVANRLAGYNTIEQGESLEATRSLGQKVMSKLPKWMTNWITGRDVSTVSNLAVACAEQVKRDYPNLKVGSDEYYDAVTSLLEEIVVKSQPIYDPQFRAEMLRSDSELLRSLAMFKTQPSQDFNQLYTAIGEYRAMKNATGEEGKAEAKAAKDRLQKTIAGQIVAKAAFSALTILADLITHRTKKYKWSSKDEKKDPEHREGEWAARKFLNRFIFGTASSAASILWFGDTVAAFAADIVTGTNPFAEDTTEFYSISESTTALINDVVKAGITMAQTIGNPDRNGWQKAKAIKELVAKAASTLGISFQNAYNIVNTIVMYELDTDQTKNFDHNDDFMRSMSNYSQMTDTNIANKTMDRVVQDYKKGKLSEAETLLATLNFDSNEIVSAVKSDTKKAYIGGKLTEAQTRTILKDYCKESRDEIRKLFEEANRQIEYNKAKAANEKAFESVEALFKSVTDKRRDDERPRDYYEVDAIVGSLLSDKEKDITVGKNLSNTYRTNYNALRAIGMKPAEVTKFLEGLDEDVTGTVGQDEMYNWYLLHNGDEDKIKTLWDAQGYKAEDTKTWEAYKESRRNMTYDTLKAARANDPKFISLAKSVAEIQDENSYQMQKTAADAEIFSKINEMKLSDEEYDAAVQKYVSPGGRKLYTAARNEGLGAKESSDLIKDIDSYYNAKSPDSQNNGSLSIAELIAYYKEHPDMEDVLKAMYYASTTSDKSWEEQKAKNKVK